MKAVVALMCIVAALIAALLVLQVRNNQGEAIKAVQDELVSVGNTLGRNISDAAKIKCQEVSDETGAEERYLFVYPSDEAPKQGFSEIDAIKKALVDGGGVRLSDEHIKKIDPNYVVQNIKIEEWAGEYWLHFAPMMNWFGSHGWKLFHLGDARMVFTKNVKIPLTGAKGAAYLLAHPGTVGKPK